MKNNPTATANALAVTGGIFYIACRILVGVFPDLMYTIAQSWFHGIGMASGSWNLSLESFFIGLISFVVFAWVTGYLFASIYNYFSKR
ncbi:MAG: hypothetical protein UT39_C0014G0018 [Candidatus Woesebacteria bacterium GW2011_GWA1_39_21]|uniref:Uncharacterized protein n=1 Tax=Candidatus Woesebacteria bacterium GW2011_GWA1_39_21 TaxID=1618550 RepID=A0A0G0N3N7_9BACT|nr:MAG: hypothetical protein UT39_C0014G0018 [Candidatus Woesebacteria bacterium GW2011_GWA1_39_21]